MKKHAKMVMVKMVMNKKEQKKTNNNYDNNNNYDDDDPFYIDMSSERNECATFW